jgi:hypothetical protein
MPDDDRFSPDACEEVWELAIFAAKEAHLLRSFIEYLRSWPDPQEVKTERLNDWRRFVGSQFRNPEFHEGALEAFRKVQDSEPEKQKEAIKIILSRAQSRYFLAQKPADSTENQ